MRASSVIWKGITVSGPVDFSVVLITLTDGQWFSGGEHLPCWRPAAYQRGTIN